MQDQLTLGYGLCGCGCGESTRLAYRTDTQRGWRKGQPMRFINGHAARLQSKPFESQFVVGSPYECWLWQGTVDKDGYGICGDGPIRRAHRIAMHRSQGYLTPGLMVCHHCDTPGCVNPSHLFEGTAADNVHDMVAKNRCNRLPKPAVSKLTAAQAAQIRERYALGNSTQRQLAKEFGVTQSNVSRILSGLTWVEAA